jgi:hypothetical protein
MTIRMTGSELSTLLIVAPPMFNLQAAAPIVQRRE